MEATTPEIPGRDWETHFPEAMIIPHICNNLIYCILFEPFQKLEEGTALHLKELSFRVIKSYFSARIRILNQVFYCKFKALSIRV